MDQIEAKNINFIELLLAIKFKIWNNIIKIIKKSITQINLEI